MFETAELVRTFRWTDRFASGRRIGRSARAPLILFVAGALSLAALWIWPRHLYPLVWLSLVFLLEPINVWLGRANFLQQLGRGDWRIVVSLSLGVLMCGFFWEFWNYCSYPKWIYHTPGAEFLHVFEMPLPGYAGYVPFAWELYSLRNLVWAKNNSFRV